MGFVKFDEKGHLLDAAGNQVHVVGVNYVASYICSNFWDDWRPEVIEKDLAKIRELDQMGYDAIVMAQVSMRALLPALTDVKTPLLCSFYSGYGAIADELNKIAEAK